MAGVVDRAIRRLAGFTIDEHHDARLAGALKMAAAKRGGDVKGLCSIRTGVQRLAVRCGLQHLTVAESMARVGSCFDNATVPPQSGALSTSSGPVSLGVTGRPRDAATMLPQR